MGYDNSVITRKQYYQIHRRFFMINIDDYNENAGMAESYEGKVSVI